MEVLPLPMPLGDRALASNAAPTNSPDADPAVNDMDGMEFHPPRSIYSMEIHGVIGFG